MAFNFIPKIIYDAGAGDVTIELTYPPKGFDPFGESIEPVSDDVTSDSGKRQVNLHYAAELYEINYSHLTKTELDAMRTFFTAHGILGKEFKYFPHKDEAGFDLRELSKQKFQPERFLPDGSNGDFLYKVKLKMRRVIL